jgi:hypothetical protein
MQNEGRIWHYYHGIDEQNLMFENARCSLFTFFKANTY